MGNETIVESSFEYTDGKMYRTIKVTMPPCDTNDDAAWAERNDLAERIRALLQAPAPQPPVQGAVAYVTGYYGGRCVVKPVNNAAVLPTNMALYAAPQPSDDVAKDAARYRWLRDRGDACQWENILRFDLEEFVCADNALDAAIDAAMAEVNK